MQIFGKCLNGKTLVLEVDPFDKIEKIEEKIQEKTGICPRHQRLSFGLKSLSIYGSLADYNIQNGATLYMDHASHFMHNFYIINGNNKIMKFGPYSFCFCSTISDLKNKIQKE